jgi:putative membrane protein
MKRHAIALALPALALLAACGGGGNTSSVDAMINGTDDFIPPTDNSMNSIAAQTPGGQEFANTVAASDAYEIAAGKLASEKATAKGLKEFGTMMVANHTESTAKLKAAGAKSNLQIVPDGALNDEQRANIDTLKSATGEDFDMAYRSQQLVAHNKALELIQNYAIAGEVPELKAFAEQAVPMVDRHLNAIKAMQP